MKMKKLHQHLSDNLSWYKHWHEGNFHKIIHYGLLVFTVLFTVVSIISSTTVSAVGTTYYVSSSGSDSNNGTSITTPWQTIAKVNATTFVAGDKILFNSGDTFYGTIKPTASGTSTNPITYGAYGTGSKPIINGFTNITGWTEVNTAGNPTVGTHIWQSNSAVSSLSDVNVISINTTNVAKGRTPNTGYWTALSAGSNSITDTTHINASTINWTGGTVVHKPGYAWYLDRGTITSSTGGTINFSGMSYPATSGWGYFIQNHPATLDTQNEWAYIPSTKKLMIYSNSAPTNVKVPTVDEGASVNKNYITFDNLNFQGFNENGVGVNASTNIIVQNSDLSFIGNVGVYTDANNPSASNITISSSNFSEINNGGVHTRGAKFVTVQNSTFNNIGNLAGMGRSADKDYSAINTFGDNGQVFDNIINNAGYVGIRFDGNATRIERNFVNNTNYIKDDGGGIYAYPNAGPSVHTTYIQRTVKDNISINAIGSPAGKPSNKSEGMCIYNDGTSSNIDYIHNTMAYCRWGFFSNAGTDLKIQNNNIYTGLPGNDVYGLWQNNYGGTGVNTSGIINNDITGNTVVAAHSNASPDNYCDIGTYAFAIYGHGTLPASFTSSNNVVANPLDQTNGWIYTDASSTLGQAGSEGRCLTLSQWQSTATNRDLGSVASPIIVSSPSSILFDYATSSPKNIDLSAGYVDMKNIVQPCSLTIPVYSSVILLKKPNTTCVGTTDTTPPSTSLTSPTTGTTVLGTTQQVAANATDNVGVTKVEFYIDGTTTLLNCTPNPDTTSPYLCIWNTTTVSNGTHTITSKAYDAAGNSAISSVVSVNVQNVVTDTTAPVFTPTGALSSPSANLSVPVGTSYDITAHATDNVGMAKVEFYKDGVLINTQTSGPNSDFTYSWNTTGLTVGSTHSWTAKAYDTATTPNVATTSARVVTITAGADTTPPTSSITNTGGYYKPGTRITLKATSSDNVGVTKTEFYVNDVKKCTDTTSPYTCSWSMPTSTTVTSYVIKAKAYDAAGNVGTSADVKMTNRKIGELSLLADAGANQTITLPTNSVTLTGSYSTNTLTTTTAWSKVSGSGTITSPTSTTTTVTGLTAGTSVFQFTVNNGAGFTTSATVTVVVNAAVNTVVFSFSAPQDPTKLGPLPNENSGTVTTIQVNASGTNPITKVDFYVDGNLVGTDNTSNPFGTVWDTTTVSNGVHLFTAKATDNLGNTGTSAAISVTISN